MASGVTGVSGEPWLINSYLRFMAVESVRSSGAHLASGGWAGQPWTLGSHCCIPSLGGVVLPLRYVFSLSFFFLFFRLLELARSPSGKGKARLWCSSSGSTAASLFSAGASEARSQAELGQTESFAVPTDFPVSQSLSPHPIARIWLLDADTDGSLLQALAFFQGGIEKPLYVLASWQQEFSC